MDNVLYIRENMLSGVEESNFYIILTTKQTLDPRLYLCLSLTVAYYYT